MPGSVGTLSQRYLAHYFEGENTAHGEPGHCELLGRLLQHGCRHVGKITSLGGVCVANGNIDVRRLRPPQAFVAHHARQ